MPQCSDLFGAKGVSALKKLRLSEPDATLLKEDLELLQLVKEQIKAQEGRIVLFKEGDEATGYLQSIPGMGKILAAVAAAEIDAIARFRGSSQTLCLCGVSTDDPWKRRQSLPGSSAQEPQQVAAMGFYRSGLGGGRLFELLWWTLPLSSRPREEGQHRHYDRGAADVSNQLYTSKRKEEL